ncbi:MAG: hypothetical protein R3C32_04150 [Chloroflexota bacterium]
MDERAKPPIRIAAQPAMLVRGVRSSTAARPNRGPMSMCSWWATGWPTSRTGRPDAREAVAARLAVDPASILVIEGAGRTMTPGLIDCHAHYLLDPRSPVMFEAEERASDARLVLAAAGRAREALGAGVTTARGAGSPRGLDVALAAAIAAGEVPWPGSCPRVAPSPSRAAMGTGSASRPTARRHSGSRSARRFGRARRSSRPSPARPRCSPAPWRGSRS